MSPLSRYQLERWDEARIVELGRRVESEQFAEDHRHMRTMGALLKARVFGATEWAIQLRKRMLEFQRGDSYGIGEADHPAKGHPEHRRMMAYLVQGGGDSGRRDPDTPPLTPLESPGDSRGLLPPEPHPDLDAEAGGRDRSDFSVDPFVGRLKVPSRYRKDESDR